jgi:regulatory protein
MGNAAVTPEVIERWALAYLGRYASSADNLRGVLLRRARRQDGIDRDGVARAAAAIEALLARYRASGLLDDDAYAAGRAQSLARHGQSLVAIRARLRAKGVGPATVALAVAGLRDAEPDPDLAAACIFARRRRLGPYRRGAADHARELGAFARAGFARHVAERILACTDIAAVAALSGRESG